MEIELFKKWQSDRLFLLGMLLFLIGLVFALFIPMMANPRMGLSAHLEGVLNGLFLLMLGLIWHKIALSQKVLTWAFWLTVYGSFANFLAVSLAAITGAGKMMPLAGGKEGSGPVESLISFLLVSLALVMIAVCILVLTGLYRGLRQTSPTEV